MDTNELIYKTETDSETWKIYGYQREEVGGGINQELVSSRYILPYVKQINKDLLYSTEKKYIKKVYKVYIYSYIGMYAC